MFLITGCPRSGTEFIARVFQKNGHIVPHECHAKDLVGVASWFHLNDLLTKNNLTKEWRPGWARTPHPDPTNKRFFKRYDYDVVVHQIREPIATISSFFALHGSTKKFFRQWLKPYRSKKELTGDLQMFMFFWLEWNRVAEKYSQYSYCVEDLDAIRFDLSQALGLSTTLETVNLVSKKTNSRKHRTLTAKDFIAANSSLANDIFSYYNSFSVSGGAHE
tara:strand:- start:46264 stop:46920 length:657 start_codon:yes stop_codon:yes gene_type:complete